MSKITDFLCGSGLDSNGMTIYDVIAQGDDWWEGCHNHIQWVFPLQEPSQFNPDAPLLTEDDIEHICDSSHAMFNINMAYRRFLNFLGLDVWTGQIAANDRFIKQASTGLWSTPNHNWLRITRVLKLLKLVGMDKEATMFYHTLLDLVGLFNIPEETDGFWYKAANGIK